MCRTAAKQGLLLNKVGLWRPLGGNGDGDGDGPHWEMLPSETEEQIFDELGVDFIEPEKRNHAFLTSKAGYMKTKGPITVAR